MLSDCLCWPVCVRCDYFYSCAVRLTNKGVRATFVVYCQELKLGCWQPLQGRGHVARPNAPPGSVFKLDDMALVVLCNQHPSAAPCENNFIVTADMAPAVHPRHARGSCSHLSIVLAPPGPRWPSSCAASFAKTIASHSVLQGPYFSPSNLIYQISS